MLVVQVSITEIFSDITENTLQQVHIVHCTLLNISLSLPFIYGYELSRMSYLEYTQFVDVILPIIFFNNYHVYSRKVL